MINNGINNERVKQAKSEVSVILSLDQKSDNFTKILNKAAADHMCVFYEESGEGHDMVTDTLYCEDVSGWLVPLDMADELLAVNKKHRRGIEWSEFFCFAEWRQEGSDIKINFKKYPIYIDEMVSVSQK